MFVGSGEEIRVRITKRFLELESCLHDGMRAISYSPWLIAPFIGIYGVSVIVFFPLTDFLVRVIGIKVSSRSFIDLNVNGLGSASLGLNL